GTSTTNSRSTAAEPPAPPTRGRCTTHTTSPAPTTATPFTPPLGASPGGRPPPASTTPWLPRSAALSPRQAQQPPHSSTNQHRSDDGCGLRQRRHQITGRQPPPGVEGSLLAHMPPCDRSPQVTHQVHDAVQFVSLESQHPLVVTERERRHRVSP